MAASGSGIRHQLAASEETFRLLVESVRDYAILMLDPEGHVRTWNRGAERIKGYRAEEIIGQHFSRFYPPEDIAAGKPAMELRVAATEGRFEDEGWRLKRDGSRFWANVIITALRDESGALRGFGKVTRDLTERKRVEDEARQSEERFRLLVESVRDYAILMLDVDGHVMSWNAGAERIKGYRAEEIIGQHFSRFYPPEEIAAGKPATELRVAAEIGRFEDEGWRLKRDGTRFWANVVVTALRDSRGQLRGYAKVTRDLTDRKRAEEEIREINTTLELLVAARTAELRTANAELESFSYTVAHDLRAPLRQVSGFASLLMEDYGEQLDAEGRRFVQKVRDGAKHMGELVDDLLNLAQLGRQALSPTLTPLKEIVEEAIDRLEPETAGRHIEWRIGELPTVSCDISLMRQVFANLLSNALKYTRKRDPAVIQIDSIADGEWPTIFVRDNGAGFDMQYAGKLFGVFQRLHKADEYEGTGVGLATVQRIIHKHGGTIWCEAAPDEGATFFFTLGHSANDGRHRIKE